MRAFLITLICMSVCLQALRASNGLNTIMATKPIDSELITVDVEIGFAGVTLADEMTHALFTIKNNTNETLAGVIEIALLDSNFELNTLTRPFELGAQSKQAFSNTITTAHDSVALRVIVDGKPIWQRLQPLNMAKENHMHLLVVDPKRKLFKVAPRNPRALDMQNSKLPKLRMRPVTNLPIESAQLPNTFLSLTPIEGILFSPKVDMSTVTKAQRRAIGGYLARGGILMLPRSKVAEWGPLLTGSLPFAQPEDWAGSSYFGLGHLAPYPDDLMNSDIPPAGRAAFYTLLDERPKPGYFQTMSPKQHYWRPGFQRPQWIRSLAILGGLALLYTLVMGPVLLLSFRLKRKQVVRRLIISIIGFSLLAILVGGFIKLQKGDANVISVIALGPNGGVRSSVFHLFSAGKTSHTLRLQSQEAAISNYDARPLNHQLGYQNEVPNGRKINQTTPPKKGEANLPLASFGSLTVASQSYVTDLKPLLVESIAETVQVTNPNTVSINRLKIIFAGSNSYESYQFAKLRPGETKFVDKTSLETNGQALLQFGSNNVIDIRGFQPATGNASTVFLFGEISSSDPMLGECDFIEQNLGSYWIQPLYQPANSLK